jgi:hypothetical protein
VIKAPSKETGGGCFIATTVFDSVIVPTVIILRNFREEVLLQLEYGKLFVSLF